MARRRAGGPGLGWALCAVLLAAEMAAGRELLGKRKKWLIGKAVWLELDFAGGGTASALLIKPRSRKRKFRVNWVSANSRKLDQLRSGMDVSVQGAWWDASQQQEADDEPNTVQPDALNDPADPAAGVEFNADGLTVSGGPQAPQPLVEPADPTPEEQLAAALNAQGRSVLGAVTGGQGSSVGGGMQDTNQGYINVTQGGGTFVTATTTPVTSLNVLIVPIVAKSASGGSCMPGSGFSTQRPPLSGFSSSTYGPQYVFSDGTGATPATPTVGSQYLLCSNLKARLTANNSFVANTVTINCTGTSFGVPWTAASRRCDFNDYNGWSDQADAILAARGLNLSNYFFRVYLLPSGPCDNAFAGSAFLGCDGSFDCRAWISGSHWDDPNAMAHELAHNMFLHHSGAGGYNSPATWNEYADSSCAMGYCCENRCWNMPHAWQLGWSTVRQYDSLTLARGRTYNLTLNSQSNFIGTTVAVRNGVRVMGWTVAGVKPDPFWVSFRTRTRGDLGMLPGLENKLHIHTSAVADPFDAEVSNWEVMLGVGEYWTHPQLNVTVRRYPSSSATIAVFTLCRYYRSETALSCQYSWDYDCDGDAGCDDADCRPFLGCI